MNNSVIAYRVGKGFGLCEMEEMGKMEIVFINVFELPDVGSDEVTWGDRGFATWGGEVVFGSFRTWGPMRSLEWPNAVAWGDRVSFKSNLFSGRGVR